MKIQLVSFAVILFGISSTFSLDQTLIALAEYLQWDQSDIFVHGLSHSQVQSLSATLLRPITVFTRFTSREKNAARYRVLVQGSDTISTSGKLTNEFRMRYLILPQPSLADWRTEEVNVSMTTYVFRPNDEGQMQIFLACPNSPKLNYINHWDPDNNLAIDIRPSVQSLRKRQQLYQPCPNELVNKHLHVVAVGLAPYMLYSKERGLYGVDAEVFQIIADKLQFTFTITHEETWGLYNVTTGTSTALINKVMTGESLFGLGDTTLNWLRYQAVDFNTYLYDVSLHYLLTKPKPLVTYFNFMRPFDSFTWTAIFITFLMGTLALVLLIKAPVGKGAHDVSQGRIWMVCYYSQLQCALKFKWTHTRVGILLGSYFIHVFFINSSYLCNLRVYLMQTNFEPPVNNDYDFVKQHRKVRLVPGTVSTTLFQNSPFQIQRDIFKSMDDKNLYFPYENGQVPKQTEAEMIVTGDAVTTIKNAGIYSFALSESRWGYNPFCIAKIPVFGVLYGSLVIPKNELWRSEVDDIIFGLLQGGIIEHTIQSFIPDKYRKEEPQDTSPRPFGIKHILGSMIVVIAGLTISVIAFILEILWSEVRKNTRIIISVENNNVKEAGN